MLTHQAANDFAKKDLPTKYGRLELQLIYGFTPDRVTDDKASWSAMVMNYYMCLGMVKLNPALGVSFMEEAGVTADSIEHALVKNQQQSISKTEFRIVDTKIAIAPPTFSDDPSLWLERGYDPLANYVHGDIAVCDGLVGFYRGFVDNELHLATGFIVGSVGVGEAEKKLLKVIRV